MQTFIKFIKLKKHILQNYFIESNAYDLVKSSSWFISCSRPTIGGLPEGPLDNNLDEIITISDFFKGAY